MLSHRRNESRELASEQYAERVRRAYLIDGKLCHKRVWKVAIAEKLESYLFSAYRETRTKRKNEKKKTFLDFLLDRPISNQD